MSDRTVQQIDYVLVREMERVWAEIESVGREREG
jgi:hypothetical protein